MYQLLNIYKTQTVIDGSIPVTAGGMTQWRWVYQIWPLAVQGNDILEVHAEHEFSNPGLDNTELMTAISVTNGGEWYDTDLFNLGLHTAPTSGGWAAPIAGGDINAQEHHRLINRSGVFTVPVGCGYEMLTSVTFKARAHRDVPSGSLVIEGYNYGSMFVKHWRAC